MQLRKVLIPAAGRGTRFLPATKAVPKEMLPVLDRPLVQYAIEEGVEAGLDRVVLITAESKEAIEQHFLPDPELERALEADGKSDLLVAVRHLNGLVQLETAFQHQPLGVGHAVLQGRELVGDEAFAVTFPDDFIVSERPVLGQLREVWEEMSGLVLAVQRVPADQIERYGVVAGDKVRDGLYRVNDMVEKPSRAEAPSDLAIVGRYILEPGIFEILEDTEAGAGGEIQLTDAILAAIEEMPCHALVFEGDRYDCGSKHGFLEATVALALEDERFEPRFREFLASL